ncbi:Protein CBG11812 [Caenorhabditis briggsae]|uniref:Exonuclease domain-containing protein n=2 Tax=Caenorhabditis briggsae TaxID=6238 RepID=A0AAE9CV12_CAEBR|nr:Protein CBG11812 [Caenorhabditis briggsae]ULT81464.1 hypothetical protein L3Y34_011409 [Caenorhabditis briggsae]CAP30907.1 Protein CBG11812 [Caenorhabditis briggsae]
MSSEYSCPFDDLLILDFETTCEEGVFDHPVEIIQMSVVVLNITDKLIREDVVFNKLVKPVVNQKLSQYCIELTGIQQDAVDKADIFSVVYQQFLEWLKKHNLDERKFAFACDGRQDMWRLAQYQFLLIKENFPAIFRQWININRIFQDIAKEKYLSIAGRSNLEKMSNFFEIKFEGHAHNAMDDVKFLAQVAKKILDTGRFVTVNETLNCISGWRNVPENIDPNWKSDMHKTHKIIARALPLVSVVRRRAYDPAEDYGICLFCKKSTIDICVGRVHKQYPADMYSQIKDPSDFATVAGLKRD